jgi:enoyl-[acyl-carrier protein] reductase III
MLALVTGGSRGIGRAIAVTLAQRGYDICFSYMSQEDEATKVKATIEDLGRSCTCLRVHLGDEASLKTFLGQIEAKAFDVYVANAATGIFKEALALSEKGLQKVFAVNFFANMRILEAIHKHMPKCASIIALSSLGAERVIPQYASIACSKAALETYFRQVAVEYAAKGIRANIVRAGLVDTGILDYLPQKTKVIDDTIARTPLARLTTPEDVAETVAFLVSKQAAMITGQTITIDGGYSLQA